MNLNTLALKPLLPIDDLGGIIVGTSRFTDDIWDLTAYIEQRSLKNIAKKIRFSYIKNHLIKGVIKQYAYYKLGKVKAQTVVSYINNVLPFFIQYCDIQQTESLEEINFQMLSDCVAWLKDEKGFSKSTCYQVVTVVAEIVRVGCAKGWRVPAGSFFSKIKLNEFLATRDPHSEVKKTPPIPADIFDKVLFSALHKEKDVLTKSGIIIQSQTGLRISEVLGIKKGCLSTTTEGHNFLEVHISKTVKGEPALHKVYANELVVRAVLELEQATEHLRDESSLQELFLIKNNGIHNLKVVSWTSRRLKNFVRRWDIRDKDGTLYPLKSHQFRATFVRDLVLKNVSLNHIMKQFSHVSMEMTMHYLMLQEHEIREIYTDMVLNPNSKIAGIRAAEIKRTLEPNFKGKTVSETETFISELAETMSFNPLPNGICLYDFRRGNCTSGDGCFFYNCPNYVTEVKFYPVLKKELDLMEMELERFKRLGRERDWQRQYIKYQYLKELVNGLEVQLNG